MTIFGISDNAARDLTWAIGRMSKIPLNDSVYFDPSTSPFGLILYDVVITPPILRLLVRILNLRLPKFPTETKERKWDSISFGGCSIARTSATVHDAKDKSYCSPEDELLLASTLGRRLLSLSLRQSPQILECLFHAPKLEYNNLDFDQLWWSAMDCERFGHLIRRSVLLKKLLIYGPSNLEAPHILVESMANSTHLKTLRVMTRFQFNQFDQREAAQMDTLARPGVHDIVGRLLQDSLSQLTTLHLAGIQLQDEHFTAIVDALPLSKLKELHVQNNNIQSPGVLAFAKQLPNIKYLTRVELYSNPWERPGEGLEECGTAILQGMLGNYSIVLLHVSRRIPQLKLVDFYCHLNRAGRRLLATSSPVPLGLWPLILERAWRDDYDNSDNGQTARQDNNNGSNGSTGRQDNTNGDNSSTARQDNNNGDNGSTGRQDNNNGDNSSTGSHDCNNGEGRQDSNNSEDESTGSHDDDNSDDEIVFCEFDGSSDDAAADDDDESTGIQDNGTNDESTGSRDNGNSDDESTGSQDDDNSDDENDESHDNDNSDDENNESHDNGNSDDESTGSQQDESSGDESSGDGSSEETEQDFRLDAVYWFLRNSPILSSIHLAHSLQNRPGKKRKIRE